MWDGQWAEGARRLLSPDALTASFPAKNQTSGPNGPASAAEVKSERKRQLSCRWKGGVRGKRPLKFHTWTHGERAALDLQDQLQHGVSVPPRWDPDVVKDVSTKLSRDDHLFVIHRDYLESAGTTYAITH